MRTQCQVETQAGVGVAQINPGHRLSTSCAIDT